MAGIFKEYSIGTSVNPIWQPCGCHVGSDVASSPPALLSFSFSTTGGGSGVLAAVRASFPFLSSFFLLFPFLSSSQYRSFMEENRILSADSKPINRTWCSCFGSSNSGSALSSPLGSELGSSTRTESDEEDDYIAELTRQMAHNTLQDDDDKHEKTISVAGLPQSTLWSGFSSGEEDMLHMPMTEEVEKNQRVKTSEELENSEV